MPRLILKALTLLEHTELVLLLLQQALFGRVYALAFKCMSQRLLAALCGRLGVGEVEPFLERAPELWAPAQKGLMSGQKGLMSGQGREVLARGPILVGT